MALSEKDQKRLEAQLKKMAHTYSEAAECVVEWTIGELALSLLGEKASITRNDFRDALERRLAATPSAQGKGSPDLDIERQRIVAALGRLDQLPTPGPTATPGE